MARTYRRSDDADLKLLVQRSAARRSARKLAEIAFGDAAIADQGLREGLVRRAHA